MKLCFYVCLVHANIQNGGLDIAILMWGYNFKPSPNLKWSRECEREIRTEITVHLFIKCAQSTLHGINYWEWFIVLLAYTDCC